MKIALMLPSLAKKGPILVAKDIVDNLTTNDYIKEIVVFYFDAKVEVDFPCQTKKISFKDKIDFDYFDIIHSHMLRPDLYLFKNKLLGNIKKAKIISTLHQYNYINLQYDFKNKFKAYIVSKLWNLFLSKHDFIVCLSKDMKKYYENQIFIDNTKLKYIYNGRPIQNLESFTNKDEIFQKIPNKSIVIGTSCLLTARKGLEQVIKVLPKIPNLYFVVLGSGIEENNLKSLASELSVLDRCLFLGFKSNPFEYYKYFDIFILPSRGEGFPLALLEAASMKKAIICSNLDVCKEAFTDNEISFFKLDDLEDLKSKILFTYHNKINFENNVYKAFLQKYTSEIMAKNYLELYKEVINLRLHLKNSRLCR